MTADEVTPNAVRYELDRRAVDYVRHQLAGGRTLSGLLDRRIEREEGSIVTYLPEGLRESDLYELGDGILPDRHPGVQHPQVMMGDGTVWDATLKSNMDEVLGVTLQSHLTAGEDRLCLFEDNAMSADLLAADDSGVRTGSLGNEVYRLLLPDDADHPDRVLQTIRRARSWPFVAALTSDPSGPESWSRETLDYRQLETAAQRAEQVLIGAYDGEGFLLWQPI